MMPLKKLISTLLLFSLALGLCACGEASPEVTTDNRPTVIITETTAVLHEETTSAQTEKTSDSASPIIDIDPVSKDEVARFLFSKLLDRYTFDLINDKVTLGVFREKMMGGTAFTVHSHKELACMHSFLESASSVAQNLRADVYDRYSEHELYGGISPDFFESSVLVFYIDNRWMPDSRSSTLDSFEKCFVVHQGYAYWDYAQIPEATDYFIGVSCWAVSKDALTEKEFWFASPGLQSISYSWLVSPYSPEDYAPGELTEEQLFAAKKLFAKVDDPALLPIPEEYKTFIDLEGNLTPRFEFSNGETIEPFFGFITSESDFENFLATFQCVMNLPTLEYDLEEGFFEDHDLLYVVGCGGETERCFYVKTDNAIELNLTQSEGDEFYITLIRVSKGLGDYYSIDLILR